MLPELTDRVKGFLARRELQSRPIALGLKDGFGGGSAEWLQRNGFYGLANQWGSGAPAWSGETVTLETALNHSVVWACNRIISESVGFLPAVLMQDKSLATGSANGVGKRVATEHPMYSAMLNAPNEEITAQGFSEMLTSHTLLGGNGFARIIRRSGTGTAMGLQDLLPQQVTPDREKTGQRRLIYVVKDGNAADKTYTVQAGKPHDILHLRGLGWDGVRGYSVITMGRQSIGSAIAAERHVGRFWARGGRTTYNLKLAQAWGSDQDGDNFRADWNKLYSNPNEAMILPPWLSYEKTGLTMVESQVLESRLFSIHEICRWFLVSPHLVGDLSRATFSNIEQLALEFVKMTLAAWLTRWEQEFWRCVLTPEERAQGYYLRHNLKALLRGDFKTRMEGYASALQNGHLNQDEVRDDEDLDPIPDGKGQNYRVQLNMQQLMPAGQDGAAAPDVMPELGS